jgi:restriction system protein
MARRNDNNILDDLIRAPWWVSLIVGLVVYCGLKFFIPAYAASQGTSAILLKGIAGAAPALANIAVIIFIFTGAMSFILNKIEGKKNDKSLQRKKELFARQRDLKDISALHWHEFEEIIAEAYRRQGYQVKECGGNGPDGGVDIILKKEGETVLVQCKHWEADQVGVKIVRELYGVLAANDAKRGIVITTGRFTRDAEMFAHGKPIDLICGNELSRLVSQGQKEVEPKPIIEKPKIVLCEKCGKEMKQRTASGGANAGKNFIVCADYPNCRNVIPVGANRSL